MPHVAMSAGMTKLYIWTSIASSAHPPKHAPKARRSLGASPETHTNAPLLVTAIGCAALALIRESLFILHAGIVLHLLT